MLFKNCKLSCLNILLHLNSHLRNFHMFAIQVLNWSAEGKRAPKPTQPLSHHHMMSHRCMTVAWSVSAMTITTSSFLTNIRVADFWKFWAKMCSFSIWINVLNRVNNALVRARSLLKQLYGFVAAAFWCVHTDLSLGPTPTPKIPCTNLRGIVTAPTSSFQEYNIFSRVCLSYQGRSQCDRSRPVQTCSIEDPTPPPSLFQLVYLGIPPLAPTWDPDLLASGSLALDWKAFLLTLTTEVHGAAFGVGVGLGQCESAITHGKLSFHRSASRQNEDWCIELFFTALYADRQTVKFVPEHNQSLNQPIMLQLLGKTADVTGLVPQRRNKTSRISEITIFYQNPTTQF